MIFTRRILLLHFIIQSNSPAAHRTVLLFSSVLSLVHKFWGHRVGVSGGTVTDLTFVRGLVAWSRISSLQCSIFQHL